jgi:RNA polymerase sigma-70 factor (ECF subfamily)
MLHLNPAPDATDGAACSASSCSGLSAADFDHFVREHHERLLAISMRLLRSPDDAADALQDALLSAWLARHSFHGQSTVYTWLYRIVKNSCLMKIRSQSAGCRRIERRAVPLDPSLQCGSLSCQRSVDSLETAEERQLLRLKIDQLPTKSRQIVWLREIEQLSTSETALRLAVTPTIVKTRLCRARAELRELLCQAFRP